MMEELKTVLAMLSSLPNTGLIILAGYLFYKVTIVGSIYGVIRFVVKHLFDWLMVVKTRPVRVEEVELRGMIDKLCISKNCSDALIAQIMRIRGKSAFYAAGSGGPEYIHVTGVDWLREAIDMRALEDCRKIDAEEKAKIERERRIEELRASTR